MKKEIEYASADVFVYEISAIQIMVINNADLIPISIIYHFLNKRTFNLLSNNC